MTADDADGPLTGSIRKPLVRQVNVGPACNNLPAMTTDARETHLRSLIRDVPDFPQPGILFKDITTLIRDREAFRDVIDGIARAYRGLQIDLVVGVESRGFIFAAPVALDLHARWTVPRPPPRDGIHLRRRGVPSMPI
ncbi:MAG: hypothetical protein EBV53_16845, partial [Proteobacteria bacterium]|nr:hypothetical protein [Pseudomonadota bacterium]